MAQHIEDGELWLPSRVLSDEMVFLEKQLPCDFPYADSVELPFDFPYADSVVSSTETESDEEDYMAGLTQRMAHSTLEDNDQGSIASKVGAMVGSPQSILFSAESWSVRSLDSSDLSKRNSNGLSQVPSPPSMPVNRDSWELLYAAAGQAAMMKINGEGGKLEERGLLGLPRKPLTVPEMKSFNGSSCQLDRRWGEKDRDSFVLAAYFEMLKQQQHRSWARQAKVVQARNRARVQTNTRFVCQAWPSVQNQSSNKGMKAVFLNNSGSKECSGTGVFLPRTGNNQTCFRKKSGCSTVLLPARVVQALNLNIDNMDCAQPSYYQGDLIPGHDGSIVLEPSSSAKNVLVSSQKRIIRSQQSVISNELRLPQEWTY